MMSSLVYMRKSTGGFSVLGQTSGGATNCVFLANFKDDFARPKSPFTANNCLFYCCRIDSGGSGIATVFRTCTFCVNDSFWYPG